MEAGSRPASVNTAGALDRRVAVHRRNSVGWQWVATQHQSRHRCHDTTATTPHHSHSHSHSHNRGSRVPERRDVGIPCGGIRSRSSPPTPTSHDSGVRGPGGAVGEWGCGPPSSRSISPPAIIREYPVQAPSQSELTAGLSGHTGFVRHLSG